MTRTNRRVSRDEADTILSRGFPDSEEIERFPCSTLLRSLVNPSPSAEQWRHDECSHTPRVLEFTNNLLSGRSEALLGQPRDEAERTFTELVDKTLERIWGNDGVGGHLLADADARLFMRLAALYHDIGKYVVRDRHATRGFHLLRDGIDPEDREALRELVGPGRWRLFLKVIKHHADFGMLGTGEASRPLMADVLPFTCFDVEEHCFFLACLMTLNLADFAAGTRAPRQVAPARAAKFTRDWEDLCHGLRTVAGDGGRWVWREVLLDEAENPANTAERIHRFLTEPAGERYESVSELTTEVVEDLVQTCVGPELPEFCRILARLCKLDYALRFVRKTLEQCIEMELPQTLYAATLIAVLDKLRESYGSLTVGAEGWRRRVGVAMADLTTNDRLADSIVKLLYSDRDRGVEWVVEECTVWFLD